MKTQAKGADFSYVIPTAHRSVGVPREDLAIWHTLQLASKLPMFKGPQKKWREALYRADIGEKLAAEPIPRPDFDLSDPNGFAWNHCEILTTPPLHDPAIRSYLLQPSVRRQLVRMGLMLPDGRVAVSLLELNAYRAYLARSYAKYQNELTRKQDQADLDEVEKRKRQQGTVWRYRNQERRKRFERNLKRADSYYCQEILTKRKRIVNEWKRTEIQYRRLKEFEKADLEHRRREAERNRFEMKNDRRRKVEERAHENLALVNKRLASELLRRSALLEKKHKDNDERASNIVQFWNRHKEHQGQQWAAAHRDAIEQQAEKQRAICDRNTRMEKTWKNIQNKFIIARKRLESQKDEQNSRYWSTVARQLEKLDRSRTEKKSELRRVKIGLGCFSAYSTPAKTAP